MLMKKRVDALTIKSGPTESGGVYVGGEVISMDKLSLVLSQHGLLLLLVMLPLGFLLYKKWHTVVYRLRRRYTVR